MGETNKASRTLMRICKWAGRNTCLPSFEIISPTVPSFGIGYETGLDDDRFMKIFRQLNLEKDKPAHTTARKAYEPSSAE